MGIDSTITTQDRHFEWDMNEDYAHVLYALVNMSDKKLENWVRQQDGYDHRMSEDEAVETAKEIRDQILNDVHQH